MKTSICAFIHWGSISLHQISQISWRFRLFDDKRPLSAAQVSRVRIKCATIAGTDLFSWASMLMKRVVTSYTDNGSEIVYVSDHKNESNIIYMGFLVHSDRVGKSWWLNGMASVIIISDRERLLFLWTLLLVFKRIPRWQRKDWLWKLRGKLTTALESDPDRFSCRLLSVYQTVINHRYQTERGV